MPPEVTAGTETTETADASTNGIDAAATAAAAAAAGRQNALEAERAKRQGVEAELATLRAAEQERTRKLAEEQGKHAELYATERTRAETLEASLGTATTKHDELRALLDAQTEKRLKALPKDSRPPIDGLPLANQIALLEYAESMAKQSNLSVGTGRGTGGTTEPIPPECTAEAARHGQDAQFWFDSVWKPRQARTKT